MARTTPSQCRQPALFIGVIAALLVCGCRAPQSSAALPPPRSDALPRYLIIGQAGATNVTTDHRFVIEDAVFVRDLFATLSQQSTNRLRSILWMPPRPFLFVDEHWDVCCGFRSRVGKQWFIFQPCWVERCGSNYVVTTEQPGVHPIPHDIFRAYLDVWNPDIP
jgi:hypothetical protein